MLPTTIATFAFWKNKTRSIEALCFASNKYGTLIIHVEYKLFVDIEYMQAGGQTHKDV